jgi:hypothetical protein
MSKEHSFGDDELPKERFLNVWYKKRTVAKPFFFNE